MASADGRFVERGRRRVQLGIVEDGWEGGKSWNVDICRQPTGPHSMFLTW